MKIGAKVRVTSKKDQSEFTGRYLGDQPLGYLGRRYGMSIETSDGNITLVREDFFKVEEIITGVKDAFEYVSDWSAGETHKRTYPMDELKKLSEALMLLHEFFEKYEED